MLISFTSTVSFKLFFWSLAIQIMLWLHIKKNDNISSMFHTYQFNLEFAWQTTGRHQPAISHIVNTNVKQKTKKKAECVINTSPFFKKAGLQQSIPFVRDINGSGYCVPILWSRRPLKMRQCANTAVPRNNDATAALMLACTKNTIL